MKKLLTILILLIFSICNVHSQNKTIKGRVITEDLEATPYVFIKVNDTVEVGRTDLKGFFHIKIPFNQEKLKFIALGHDPVTIKFVDKCKRVEVVMMMTGTYDFMSDKRAERKRKKKI